MIHNHNESTCSTHVTHTTLTMRSTVTLNPIRDTTRPPPPVPPRPSKAIIAEALAKSRALTSINTQRPKPIPKPRQQIPSKSTEDLTAEPPRTVVYRSPSLRNDEVKVETESIYGKIRPLQDQKFKSMSDITKEVPEKRDSESDSDYFSSLGNMESTHTVLIIDSNQEDKKDWGNKENNDSFLRRQRKSDSDNKILVQSKIQQSDWFEVGDNGKQVRYSSCQITINESEPSITVNTKPVDYPVLPDALLSRIKQQYNNTYAMSSLQGLPPLPKSLSGFNLAGAAASEEPRRETNPFLVDKSPTSPGFVPVVPPRTMVSPQQNNLSGAGLNGDASRCNSGGRKLTTLDTQLAVLRREMCGLRQLDLSLLSQLWSLNESIQDFRQLLQEQEESGALSPPSPSPSPSSEGDDIDDFYSPPPIRFRPAPPPPPLRKTSNSSSATSSEYGTV